MATLREKVRNLLVLHREGRREEALQGVVRLAEDWGTSSLVLNLLGDLSMDACLRGRDSDREAAREHGQCAVDAYRRATAAARDCVKTSASNIASLSEMNLHLEAQQEALRVEMEVQVADDPQIHHVFFDLDGANPDITKVDRVKSARDDFTCQVSKLADRERDDIKQVLCRVQSLGDHSAVAAAANIAERYPTSARAQHLPVYLQIEMVRTLIPHDKWRRDVEHAVDDMKRLASTFPNSLAISHYYAKLLIITGSYATAENECRRALSVDDPQLPEIDQIPGIFLELDDSSAAGQPNISEG